MTTKLPDEAVVLGKVLETFMQLMSEAHLHAAKTVDVHFNKTPTEVIEARDRAMANFWRQRITQIPEILQPFIITLTPPAEGIPQPKNSHNAVVFLNVDGQQTAYAAEAIRIGSSSSCHIVAPGAIALHAMLSRRPDGYLWLMNLHPEGAGVAVRTPGRLRTPVTGNVVVLPEATITVGGKEIRVIDC